MPETPSLFIDDGGVMNDNSVRGEQWAVLVGRYFSARVGGDAGHWAAVNRSIFKGAFETVLARMPGFRTNGEFEQAYADVWVTQMFSQAGFQPPVSPAARMQVYHETGRLIPPQVLAAFPGVADAVRALRGAGFELHTASGESSVELEGYLRGMEVRDCFGGLYGPDIVDIPKAGPEYYRRMFAHADVAPATALVFDDSPEACGWAEAAGARAMLVDHDRAGAGFADIVATLIR